MGLPKRDSVFWAPGRMGDRKNREVPRMGSGKVDGYFWITVTMNEIIQFIIQHGYVVLFIMVLADQMGIPMPATPMLLAAGALAGMGSISFIWALVLGVIASLMANILWYGVGRYKGGSVLSLLCQISLNPDSCIRDTAVFFSRHGARSLLVAKFIPGLSTITPPLAGVFRMKLGSFLIYNSLGAGIWVGTMIGLGYVFSHQIEVLADYSLRMGALVGAVLIGGLAVYIVWKIAQRRKFIRHFMMARILPEELKMKMDSGEEVLILDVRHALEFLSDPQMIPGALPFPLEQLNDQHGQIPRDREVIVYCN